MPDAFGRPTPEEERIMRSRMSMATRQPPSPAQAAAANQQAQTQQAGMTAGMQVPQSIGAPMGFDAARASARNRASRSVTGQENAIESQRELANALRGRKMPKGQTVGPYGVYMGNNWGQVAENFGEKIAGGLMARDANKRDTALDEQRLAKTMAAAEYNDLGEDRDRTDRLTRDEQAQENLEETRRIQQEQFAATQAAAKEARDEAAALRAAEKAAKKKEKQARVNADVLSEAGDEAMDVAKDRRERADDVLKESKERMEEATDKGEDLTEAQRTARYRAETMTLAIDDMQGILDEGYDPTGAGAFIDRLTNQSDITRFMTSEAGEQFQSAASTAKDAALRTATGAAAPNTEQTEYMQMLIPLPGESKNTILYKMNKLKEFRDILTELGGDGEAAEMNNYEEAVLRLRKEGAVENIPDGQKAKGRGGQGGRRKKDDEDEFDALWGSEG